MQKAEVRKRRKKENGRELERGEQEGGGVVEGVKEAIEEWKEGRRVVGVRS